MGAKKIRKYDPEELCKLCGRVPDTDRDMDEFTAALHEIYDDGEDWWDVEIGSGLWYADYVDYCGTCAARLYYDNRRPYEDHSSGMHHRGDDPTDYYWPEDD